MASAPALMAGLRPVSSGMVIRFCADQPGVSVVKVDPALSYVKLEELVVGIIDQTTPAGFMKVI
jgi:hypothetical protein